MTTWWRWSAAVAKVRVDRNNRCALGQQHLGEQAQITPGVPVPEHRRLADKGVDDPGSVREMRQMRLWPGPHGVCLRVGEWAALVLHDPLLHQGLAEVLRDQGFLAFRVAPPTYDLWCPQPAGRNAQVRTCEGPEMVWRCDLVHRAMAWT